MEAKISVIIPIYNTEVYLRQCIDSVIQQTWKNLEIILVDDGSTDRCLQICEEYKKRDERIVVIHKENGGLSSARNAGLSAATGEYVGFVDSDDWISKGMYEHLVQAIEKTGSQIAITNMEEMYEYEQKYVNNHIKFELENLEILRRFFLREISESVCDKLYKRSLFNTIRFSEGEINEDTYVVFCLLKDSKKVPVLQNKEYFYRKRQGSITKSGYSDKFRVVEKHLKDIAEIIHKTCPQIEEDMNYFCSIHYYYLLLSILNSDQPNSFKEDYKRYKKTFKKLYPQFKKNGTGKKKDIILATLICINLEKIIEIYFGRKHI